MGIVLITGRSMLMWSRGWIRGQRFIRIIFMEKVRMEKGLRILILKEIFTNMVIVHVAINISECLFVVSFFLLLEVPSIFNASYLN